MMQTPKFKMWDPFNGVMIYSDWMGLAKFFTQYEATIKGENNPVLMQCTNLRDKNNVEIYGEGDIYKDAKDIVSIVEMAADGWALFPIKKNTPIQNLYWHNICDATKGEVIGNVHPNPELLKKEGT